MRSDAGTAPVRYLEALVSASCEGMGTSSRCGRWEGQSREGAEKRPLTLGGHRRQLEPVEPVSWRQESHSKERPGYRFLKRC
jgi:hypothetical protein